VETDSYSRLLIKKTVCKCRHLYGRFWSQIINGNQSLKIVTSLITCMLMMTRFCNKLYRYNPSYYRRDELPLCTLNPRNISGGTSVKTVLTMQSTLKKSSKFTKTVTHVDDMMIHNLVIILCKLEFVVVTTRPGKYRTIA
jgi:hypothetical protein